MALAACSYMSLYKEMAKQADWKTWTPVSAIASNSSTEKSTGIKSTKTTNIYSYTNGGSRSEVIEYEDATKANIIKTTNTITLPQRNLIIIAVIILIQLLFVCMAYGPIAAFLVELFPPRLRYTSLSLPYHIGNGVFGGLTPLIAESMVVGTGNIFAGLWYPIIVAGVTVILGVFLIKEKPI